MENEKRLSTAGLGPDRLAWVVVVLPVLMLGGLAVVLLVWAMQG